MYFLIVEFNLKIILEEYKKTEGNNYTTFKKEKILLTSRSGEEISIGMKYRVKFEIECDMNQLEPIVTDEFFEMAESYQFLNIHIKSKYGNIKKDQFLILLNLSISKKN